MPGLDPGIHEAVRQRKSAVTGVAIQMNKYQRQLLVFSLVVIGLVLAFLMLEWGDGFARTHVFVLADWRLGR